MAPGFKFPPPPPPPPPKAPSNDAPNPYTSQRGGQGRGGTSGRGRGNFRDNSRGGHQHTRGGSNGGRHRGGRGGTNSYRTSSETQQTQTPRYTAPHPSTNPNLADASFSPPVPVDPGALVHAMAFMSTPAGMQSMAAFANHMAAGNTPDLHNQPGTPQQALANNQSPSLQVDSRKRKRGDRAGHWQSQQQQSHVPAAKPPRAKAKAAPSVPGFGFSLPLPPAASPSAPSKAVGGQNKKRPNLGFTQLTYDSDEEEEDEDEEAAFASKWNGKGITFEHNGDVISLESGAEVMAYIKDRKKNYPTQERIAAKAQEAREKRAHELEFLRKVKGAPKTERAYHDTKADSQRQKTETNDQAKSAKPKIEDLRERVERSIKSKSNASMPPTGSAQRTVDLGVGYTSGTESEADGNSDASSVLSESSVVSSSDSSDDDDSDAVIDDDDAPPEAQSSKVPVAPVAPPPAPKRPEQMVKNADKIKNKVCSQWKATGKCKYKYCQYKHAEDEPRVVGLYERMMEMELEKADRQALEAIKYLGRNGFLG